MQWRGVRRLSVRPSVNFCANRFFSQANGRIATKLALGWLQVSMHPGVLKVKVKGHVIRALLCWHKNGFFSQANGLIATKLAHDGHQVSLHPGCSQGQGQRSHDTRTFLYSWNELLCHWRSGCRLLRWQWVTVEPALLADLTELSSGDTPSLLPWWPHPVTSQFHHSTWRLSRYVLVDRPTAAFMTGYIVVQTSLLALCVVARLPWTPAFSRHLRNRRWGGCVYVLPMFFSVFSVCHKIPDKRSRERLNGFSWNFY